MIRLKDKNLLNEDYLVNLRTSLQENYVYKPFYSHINNDSINIIQAPTAFGKTYATWNGLSPYFLENHGCLHIHVAPHLETIDEREIESYISYSFNQKSFFPLVRHNGADIDWTHLRQSLMNGRKVILILSDQKLRSLMEYPKSPIEMIVSDYGNEVLITRDEMSWGTTSTVDNYQNNQGYSSNKYKGTYINNLITLHNLGANFFGFTATPTREQKGELENDFGKDIKIINEWPDKSELVFFQKWIRQIETRDYTISDYGDKNILRDGIKWISDKIEWREREIQDILYNTRLVDDDKFTGMISLQTRYKEKEDRMTLDSFLQELKEYPNLVNHKYTLIVATSDGWTEYDHKGDETGEKGKGSEWLTLMNSNFSSARILVTILKGNYGINIPSLCCGNAFRNPNPKTKDTKQVLIQAGKQYLGRFNRSNINDRAWKNFCILYKEYSEEKAYLYMDTRNTFDFQGPSGSNGYWDKVIDEFKQDYCNTFSDAYSQIWDFHGGR